MKLYNSTQSKLILNDLKIANTFISRSIGLISKKELPITEGLLIKPCCSIHTFFMKFNIDVIFVNRKNKIIALYENVKPWQILPIHPFSTYVIELKGNTISANNIKKYDILNIEN